MRKPAATRGRGGVPRILMFGLVLTMSVLAQARAQIVNTLRGFNDEELGWSGVIGWAIDLRTGNSRYLDAELDGRLQYQSDRHRVRAVVVTDYRTSQGEKKAESILAHTRHSYRLLPWLASIAYVQWMRDPFIRIASRSSVGVGGRVDLFREHGWPVGLGTSLMLEREKLIVEIGFPDPIPSKATRTNYRFSFFITVYSTKLDKLDVDVWGIFEPVVGDLTIARSSGSARVSVNIVGGLRMVTTYTITHDSDPPAAVEDLDSRLRVGLNWRF